MGKDHLNQAEYYRSGTYAHVAPKKMKSFPIGNIDAGRLFYPLEFACSDPAVFAFRN
jgi:hypothetical protein